MNNMNVLVCVIDVANQANLIKNGFILNGYNSKTFILTNKNSNDYDYTLFVNNNVFSRIIIRIKLVFYFIKFLFKFDIFVFQGGESFFFLFDYFVLKFFNKKIVTILNGSETRWWPAFHQIKHFNNGFSPYLPSLIDLKDNRLDKILRRIYFTDKYSNLIISTREIKLFGNRSFIHFFVPVDLPKKNILKFSKKDKLLIAHSPSNKLIKGTFIIENVLKNLSMNYSNFEYLRLEGLSNVEVYNILDKVDIFIEQIGNVMHGKSSVEAMSRGCIVLSEIDKSFICQLKNCPIISINSVNLENILSKILDDYSKFDFLKMEGIQYVHNYHSPYFFASTIINNLESLSDDYLIVKPYFFENEFLGDTSISKKISKVNFRS
jgi:hypothetical protein